MSVHRPLGPTLHLGGTAHTSRAHPLLLREHRTGLWTKTWANGLPFEPLKMLPLGGFWRELFQSAKVSWRTLVQWFGVHCIIH